MQKKKIQGNIMYHLQYQYEWHDQIARTGATNNTKTEKMFFHYKQSCHETKGLMKIKDLVILNCSET